MNTRLTAVNSLLRQHGHCAKCALKVVADDCSHCCHTVSKPPQKPYPHRRPRPERDEHRRRATKLLRAEPKSQGMASPSIRSAIVTLTALRRGARVETWQISGRSGASGPSSTESVAPSTTTGWNANGLPGPPDSRCGGLTPA